MSTRKRLSKDKKSSTFYVLDSLDGGPGPYAWGYLKDAPYERIECDKCKSVWARDLPGTVYLELDKPKVGDFLGSSVPNFSATERVVEIFKRHKIMSFETDPVEVVKVKGGDPSKLPKYQHIRVTGSGGHLLPKSGVWLEKECKACGHVSYNLDDLQGFFIDVDQWDGSDMFHVTEAGVTCFVTQRVADIIQEYELTNCKLFNAEHDRGWKMYTPKGSPPPIYYEK